jgi:hypothetical protein
MFAYMKVGKKNARGREVPHSQDASVCRELTGCSECYPIGLEPGKKYKCTVKSTFSISIGTINLGLNLGK